jgi:hypothetical protein
MGSVWQYSKDGLSTSCSINTKCKPSSMQNDHTSMGCRSPTACHVFETLESRIKDIVDWQGHTIFFSISIPVR